LALRKSDIGEKVLFVRHSWSPLDGLKCPKNGDERKVPLLPEVRKNLMELLAENPHDTNDPFVFYGLLEDKPMDNKILIDGLHDAIDTLNEKLEKNNLKDDKIDWKERGIVFHSHRHYFAARMADKMTVDQITRITGHKSQAVFEEYADHVINENLEVMAEAAAESFEKILKFPEQKGA
jgi:integrase